MRDSAVVLAFACPVISQEKFERWALPGIRRAAESDSVVVTRYDLPLQTACNQMLDELAPLAELEGAVFVHEDLEIIDDRFATKARAALADPHVAIVGAVGSRNVTSLAHWEGEQIGGVWAPQLLPGGRKLGEDLPETGDVDAVDGLLLVLSRWAVRELRFDPAFTPYRHGYDIDLCFQARTRGRFVRVESLDAVHHCTPDFFDRKRWIEAAVLFQHKWGRGPDPAAPGYRVGPAPGAGRG